MNEYEKALKDLILIRNKNNELMGSKGIINIQHSNVLMVFNDMGLAITRLEKFVTQASKEHELLELYRKMFDLREQRSSINIPYEDFENHELTIEIRKLRNQIKELENSK